MLKNVNLESFEFSKEQLEEIRKKSILECCNWWET